MSTDTTDAPAAEARTREPRPDKVAKVDEIKAKLAGSDAAIVTEYRGLTVGDMAELRTALRDAGGEYKVYKNTLVKRAAAETGHSALDDILVGPAGITFVQGDLAAVAKALRDFAKTHPLLVLKGGVLGDAALSPADVTALADLPSREALLAQLAGAFQAPLVKTAGLLQALPRNMAYGLQALIDQKEAA